VDLPIWRAPRMTSGLRSGPISQSSKCFSCLRFKFVVRVNLGA
jgi:hypothetical protein